MAGFQTITAQALEAMLPIGYYANQVEDGSKTVFFRVKRTAKNSKQYPPHTFVVQQCHGSGMGLNYSPVCFVRDEIIVAFKPELEPELMTVMCDYLTSARLFAELLGRCARCFAELTDERSRHYGIGPECEKHWPSYIGLVDEKYGEFNV